MVFGFVSFFPPVSSGFVSFIFLVTGLCVSPPVRLDSFRFVISFVLAVPHCLFDLPAPTGALQVEATKFTEVGFHGQDVDRIIKDLVEVRRVEA